NDTLRVQALGSCRGGMRPVMAADLRASLVQRLCRRGGRGPLRLPPSQGEDPVEPFTPLASAIPESFFSQAVLALSSPPLVRRQSDADDARLCFATTTSTRTGTDFA